MGLIRQAAKAVFAAADFVLPRLRGPRILIYHQVGTDLGREMEVLEADFLAQLDWLQDNGEIVDLDTAQSVRQTPGAEKLFVLTFDDGYRDLYEVAFPHLASRRVPFVLYLTTEHIETQSPLSHPLARPLTWAQINNMLDSGLLTIGAHTHTHPDVRSLGPHEFVRELDRSNDLIERRANRRPRHFAYPWGYWSAAADHLVRERYESAALGAPTRSAAFTDPYLIPRLPVQRSDGVFFFRARMRRGLRWEEHVRRQLRGRSSSGVGNRI